MKKLAVFVLVLSVFGATAFAQGLPRGATAWEYATLLRNRAGYGFTFEWYAPAVPTGIDGDMDEFSVAFAEAYGINFDRVKDDLPVGVSYALNLAGLVGWEVVAYTNFGSGEFEALLKRPRR